MNPRLYVSSETQEYHNGKETLKCSILNLRGQPKSANVYELLSKKTGTYCNILTVTSTFTERIAWAVGI